MLEYCNVADPKWWLPRPIWLQVSSDQCPQRTRVPIHRKPAAPHRLPELKAPKSDESLDPITGVDPDDYALEALRYLYQDDRLDLDHLAEAREHSPEFRHFIDSWARIAAMRRFIVGQSGTDQPWQLFVDLGRKLRAKGKGPRDAALVHAVDLALESSVRESQFNFMGDSHVPRFKLESYGHRRTQTM